MTERIPAAVVRWQGDLLWPTTLPSAPVIDARAVTAWGVWVDDWLRAHPGIAVVGGEQVRDRLTRAEVPVRWYRAVDEAVLANDATVGGVSPSERAMLWE